MNWLEKFECANCNHIGPLNTRGRCEHCESNQVLSIERINHAAKHFAAVERLAPRTDIDVAYHMDYWLA